MSLVQQPWLSNLNLKTQTALIQGLRGPDQHHCPNLKKIHRWMRSLVLVNADPEHSFMRDEGLPELKDFEHELEYLSMHYVLHLVYSLEILGYKHPEQSIRIKAETYYRLIVSDLFHFNFERESEMDHRLADTGSRPEGKPPTKFASYINDFQEPLPQKKLTEKPWTGPRSTIAGSTT